MGRRRTWIWIAVGAVVALTLVGVGVALIAADLAGETALTRTASPTRGSAQGAESTSPESSTPSGTFENPYPVGFSYVVTDHSTGVDVFAMSVRLLPVAEQSELLVGDGAKPAPAGRRNAVVEYTVRSLDPTQLVDPGVESINWQVVDQDGTVYDSLLVLTTRGGSGELPAGETWVAQALFQVPAVTTNLVLSAYGAYAAL